jgi:amino-acid N-acetyltransferase
LLFVSTASTTLVRGSTGADLLAVRELLVDAGLVVEDFDSATGLLFWVAENDDQVIGAVGLEPFGTAGLLRSLVVARSHRQQGLGSALVTAVENGAKAEGAEVLVLLTETAEAFFKRHGYRVVERASVRDEIKRSAEFRSLCPASAVCMTKLIGSSGAGGPGG